MNRMMKAIPGAILAAAILTTTAIPTTVGADEPLREVYFHDLARNRIGNVIVAQIDSEREILVFSGGELALEGDNLIVIADHARIDADTIIRSFTQTGRLAKPGKPNQAAAGANGANDGDAGMAGAAGNSGVAGDDGASAGKVILRIGEVTGSGRLIVDLYGQAGGKGQKGGQGGNGGDGRNGRARVCGGDEPQAGGAGGDGGIGGQGGVGGRGGNGGIVIYSNAMQGLIPAGKLIVSTKGGAGGGGGDAGDPGNPGDAGAGGAGAIGCGEGATDGKPGRPLTGAQPGPVGSPGSAGAASEEEHP